MNYLLAALVALSIIGIQLAIGGTRLVFSQPAYAAIALAGVLSVGLLTARRLPPSRLCMASALLLAGYVILRALFSPVEYLARYHLYATLAALIVYLITALLLQRQTVRLAMGAGLLLMGVAHAVLGAIQFSQNDNFMLFGLIRADYGTRASGFLICPNHLAGYLEVVAVMAAAAACWSRLGIKTKLLVGYGALVLLFGVAITGSRGGYLSTTGAFALLLLLSLRVLKGNLPERFWQLTAICTLVAVACAGTAVSLMGKHGMIRNRMDNLVNTNNNRFEMWEAARSQFALEPALGTGSRTFLYYGRQLRPAGGYIGNDPEFVHNDYLQMLAEYGVVGLSLAALFLFAHLRQGFHTVRWITTRHLRSRGTTTSNVLALQMGALCGVVAIVLHSVVDFNMQIPGNLLLMALVFGMIAGPGIETSSQQARRRGTAALLSRLIAPAAGLWLAWLVVPKLPAEYWAETARVALREKQYKEVIEHAKKGLRHDPLNPELHHHLGMARLQVAGQMPLPALKRALFAGAAEAFRDGLRLFPQDLYRQMNLGQALDGMGDFEGAAAAYRQAVHLGPSQPMPYAFFGLHFERQDQPGEAERWYRAARSLGGSEIADEGLKRLAEQARENP